MRKNGVQYASTTIKRCPMSDDVCAAKVAEHISKFYGPTSQPCDCAPFKRLAESLVARKEEPGFDIAAAVLIVPECLDTCASRTTIPFNAAALIEERCGRFTRGKSVGQLRGWAEIEVVTEGGWKKTAPGEGNGYVAYPGRVLSVKISDFSGKVYLEVR